MSMSSSKRSGVLILMPGARLDTQTSPEAEAEITAAIGGGERRILIDLARTDYVSSAGLRVLLKATKQLRQNGGDLGLCNANPQIREVLDISGFAKIMPCYPNLGDGLQVLGKA